MKLLLDTHVWIWALSAPERLSPAAVAALQSADHELWLSPISVWELSVLVRKGRLTLDQPLESWVSRGHAALPVREAPLTQDVALETTRVTFSHPDPADQFLVASARIFRLILVTADQRLHALSGQGLDVLW